ncbi:hypothetical protein Q1695_010744 [Nippostrongylus brasiliensis]|nr:hypothetical protein Q1695_010744 [Nippostrongylus brasiliensis]
MKEKFIRGHYPKAYRVVPIEVKRIVGYIDSMAYADEPDYLYIQNTLRTIAKERRIDLNKQLDWIGKKKKKSERSDGSDISSDERQTGDDDSDSEDKKLPERKR